MEREKKEVRRKYSRCFLNQSTMYSLTHDHKTRRRREKGKRKSAIYLVMTAEPCGRTVIRNKGNKGGGRERGRREKRKKKANLSHFFSFPGDFRR